MRETRLISLSRRDILRLQINCAIDLLFNGSSPVLVHTLASAAFDIVSDLLQNAGIEGMRVSMEQRVRPQYLKEWRFHMKRHANFLKHANRDPEDELEDFNPESAWITLYFAVADFSTLFSELTFEMSFYHVWIVKRYPDWFHQTERIEQIRDAYLFDQGNSLERASELFALLKARGAQYTFGKPS